MSPVRDLTPKFRVASTQEKVRKKEVETLLIYQSVFHSFIYQIGLFLLLSGNVRDVAFRHWC